MDSGAGPAALAATCGTDEFAGSALDDARWDVAAARAARLDRGRRRHARPPDPRRRPDQQHRAPRENVVAPGAPRSSGWTATTRLDTAAIDANGEQAGLALWKSRGPAERQQHLRQGRRSIQTNSGDAPASRPSGPTAAGSPVPTGDSGRRHRRRTARERRRVAAAALRRPRGRRRSTRSDGTTLDRRSASPFARTTARCASACCAIGGGDRRHGRHVAFERFDARLRARGRRAAVDAGRRARAPDRRLHSTGDARRRRDARRGTSATAATATGRDDRRPHVRRSRAPTGSR